MIVDDAAFFEEEGETTELVFLNTGDRLHISAFWNFGDDPLFEGRAAATSVNFTAPSHQLIGINQNDLAIRANGDRYVIRSLEPTSGDGQITTVNVSRE